MLTTITTIVSATIAVAAFLVGIFQYRRSVHIDIFRKYADKYNSIITSDKYDKWQSALAGKKDDWAELTPIMIQYLNLIWEEFFLLQTGIMPRGLWRLWLPEIERVLATDFAKMTIAKYEFHFPKSLTGEP